MRYASFLKKGLMIRRIRFFDDGPIIVSMMSKRTHIEYTGKEKGHTHTIVFRPSLSIAGRLRSCGNALLYIPFVTSAKLTGSSDAGGSFSKDGPCSWFLTSRPTWVSKKRWKVMRDMRHKLTSLTV